MPVIPEVLSGSESSKIEAAPSKVTESVPAKVEDVPQSEPEQQLVSANQQSFDISQGHSFSFMSLSTGWWKLLELLGVFGVF